MRGTPQQIIDKYNQLARDAQLSNDRVAAENFQQHAEHYLRLLSEAQREVEARREEQDRQNRERQAERDRERAARQDADTNEQPAFEDPGSAPQPDMPQPTIEVAEVPESGLVETPEDKPKPKRTRTRKPKVEPVEEQPVVAATEDGDGPAPEAAE